MSEWRYKVEEDGIWIINHLNEYCGSVGSVDTARFYSNAMNELNTSRKQLKAKAELLDEALKVLQGVLDNWPNDCESPLGEVIAYSDVESFIQKAKEIKGE